MKLVVQVKPLPTHEQAAALPMTLIRFGPAVASASAAVVLAMTAACAPSGAPGAGTTRQYGFALPVWSVSDYQSSSADSYVRAIAATGAGWIQFNPTWYQPDRHSVRIGRTEETASDASLRHIIGLARDAGLRVLLKPHIDLPGDGDRATISPRSRTRWFAAYRSFITHYATLATDTGVTSFAVGTELTGVAAHRVEWSVVIRDVRARFSGQVVYAANYDAYEDVSFWDLVDVIGIDAYWPLAAKPTTSVPQLKRAWRPRVRELAAFAAQHRKQILFTEAGYVSQRGTVTTPYSWTVSKVRDDDEQAAAYEALLASFSGEKWWAGVHFWMWDDWPGSDETPRSLAYTPHGKRAELIARRWFAADPHR